MAGFDVFAHTALLTRAGSRAYGTHTAGSDLDVKGILIPPMDRLLGLEGFEQVDAPEHFQDPRILALLTDAEREIVKGSKIEGSIYALRKAMELLLATNPNMLDPLFCRDSDILHITPAGELLREHRNIVLSLKAKPAFTGYAFAQLKRIKLHRAYLLSPPTHKPTRAEFGLPESTLIPADQLAAAEALVKKKMDSWEMDLSMVPSDAERLSITLQLQSTMAEITAGLATDRSEADAKWRAGVRAVGLDDNLLEVLERERRYKGAKAAWDSYQTWTRTRNPARAELEAKYTLDTKHASHLVRLLRMGIEIIKTGVVNVCRTGIDADELVAIRNGAWSYEQLVEYADAQEAVMNELYTKGPVALPHAPDRAAANALVIKLHEMALRQA